ncbi:Ger(x)C family spore germination protein [Texcoconibacillus texcoconensis]|uniref:Spore germination protein KC n=1 Tax=Texcoconibacillus texcoconensis TaxID=1095777 RepID=A0A840QLP7_9BACI|nr:Ger(x)C family spore germination protein [Texcoconibacillus texcoconensis]MBB5172288.1 spore germination protein KC [Texcoconibacillus texcoconensis]
MNHFQCKKILHRCRLLIFLSVLTLLLSGCWDRQEINDLAIVLGAGIDITDEGLIDLSVEIVTAQEGQEEEQGGAQTYVESATGQTVVDATSTLQQKLSRQLFWGQMEAIIMSENMAREGVHGSLDFFARQPQTRLRNYIYVTEENPKEVFAATPHLEVSTTKTLAELSEFQAGLNVTTLDFLRALESEGEHGVLPMVETLPQDAGKEEEQTDLMGNRAALFKRDKMIESIDMDITRGVMWLRDEIEGATVTLSPERSEGLISMYMIRSDVNFKPQIQGGTWKILVEAKSEDDIFQNASNLDLKEVDNVKMLEGELATQIEDRMRETLEVVQQDLQLDVFGFGETFRRKYPEKWDEVRDQWDEKFAEVEVDFDIETIIHRPGLSSEPTGLPEGEVEE